MIMPYKEIYKALFIGSNRFLNLSLPFEILNLPLMFFSGLHRFKSSQIAAFLCLRVGLPRIKPVFPGF